MSEQYQLSVQDYVEIVRRRWVLISTAFSTVFLISIAIAMWMPPVYESSGTVLIESQQIPDALIRSTVTSFADERIQLIKQRVMTRENLLRVIDKYELLQDTRGQLTASEQVALMRERVRVASIQGTVTQNKRRNRATIAFTVGFEDSSPRRANRVANELITLFLDENVKTRTERASETTEFLSEEARKLKIRLEGVEEKIAAFKQENSHALPEHLDLHVGMLERTDSDMKEIKRSIKDAEEENRFLEIEASALKLGVRNRSDVAMTPGQSLVAAEAELASLRSRYSDKHPDVKRLIKKVSDLRAEVEIFGGQGNSGLSSALEVDLARVHARIDSINKRSASLRSQYQELLAKREELEKTIVQTPQVQRALTTLNRDYENTLKKYKEIQGKEMEAKLAQSLEQEKKAERFTLLEPPIVPEKPIKPNRKKMVAMGFFLALAAAFGLVTMLEYSDQRVRGEDALVQLLKERPLVAVPYISIDSELTASRIARRWFVAVIVLLLIGSLLGVHFFYMPLELLGIKAMARFS